MTATRNLRPNTRLLVIAAVLAAALAVALLAASTTAASASAAVPPAATLRGPSGPPVSPGAIYLVVMLVGAAVAFTGRKVRMRDLA